MEIDFNKMGGIVPVITQDSITGKILMLAFVNEEAFKETLRSGKAVYFSRSKNRLWRKGEESGNFQEIKDILIDCDNDSIIYKVIQKGLGAACHEGYESCFFRHLENGKWVYNGEIKKFNPKEIYNKEQG